MSNRLRKLKRYYESMQNKEYTKNKMVHGYMVYECDKCGGSWKMYLEKGLAEGGENHKPVPFVITCKCGGTATDASGLIKLQKEMPLMPWMNYFANKKNCDCGYLVLV